MYGLRGLGRAKFLSEAEVYSIYKGNILGKGMYLYPRVSQQRQFSRQRFNSSSYIPVISSNVEVLKNTNISISSTGYFTNFNDNNNIECRLVFDGDVVGYNNYSIYNQNRSFYVGSNLFEKDPGVYLSNLECKSENVFEVNNTNIEAIQYINSLGYNINVFEENKAASISTSGYGQFGFVSSNTSLINPIS